MGSLTGSATRVVFEYEALRIGVSGQDPTHLVWLEEFLTPQFETTSAGAADVELSVRCDLNAFEALEGPGPGSAEIDGFANDTAIVRFPFRVSEAGLVAFDSTHQVFYRVTRDRSQIEILAAANSWRIRLALLKSVRELAMNWVRGPESLILHAAGFEYEGEGVLIAGPKTAGKTSLLTYSLAALPASYVTNDRVWIGGGRRLRLRGIPTIVTIREGTLDLFPRMAAPVRSGHFHTRLSLAEAAAGLPPPSTHRAESYGITPAQFCSLLSTARVPGGPPRAILFPRRDVQPGPLRMRDLGPGEARHRIAGAVFGVNTKPASMPLFSFPRRKGTSEPTETADLCSRLAGELRCFDCWLGPQAYAHPDSVEALRRAFR